MQGTNVHHVMGIDENGMEGKIVLPAKRQTEQVKSLTFDLFLKAVSLGDEFEVGAAGWISWVAPGVQTDILHQGQVQMAVLQIVIALQTMSVLHRQTTRLELTAECVICRRKAHTLFIGSLAKKCLE